MQDRNDPTYDPSNLGYLTGSELRARSSQVQQEQRASESQARDDQRRIQRSGQVDELSGYLAHIPENIRRAVAEIALDRNFSKDRTPEDLETNILQANALAKAVNTLVNANDALVVGHGILNLMPMGNTSQRNAVRFDLAEDIVEKFLKDERKESPEIAEQNATDIVRAAVPLARSQIINARGG